VELLTGTAALPDLSHGHDMSDGAISDTDLSHSHGFSGSGSVQELQDLQVVHRFL